MKEQHMIKIILLAAGIAWLGGCASMNRSVPTAAEESGYTAGIAGQYAAQAEWWRDYHIPELDRLVETALANNPDYLKAALYIEKELAALNIARSALFPTFYSNLGISSQKQLNKNHQSANTFSGELGLNYELDLYGKIRDARSAQEFEYQATMMDRETARLSLVNSVVDLYFNLEYLKNSIDLATRNVKTYQDIQNIVEIKHQQGLVDALSVAQANQSLIAEQNQLLELQTQFQDMEQSLRNIIHSKPDDPLDLTYADILKQENLNVDIDVPLAVLAKRPDILASQYRLEATFKNLSAEEKDWYPTVSLKGAIGSTSDKARTTFDFPFLLGSVAVDLPFLDWSRVKNNIRISEADYKIALIDFQDALTQALNETAYYYFAYTKSVELYDHAKESHQNSGQIADYYETRYHAGKVELKDFLEALNSKISAEQALVQQKYQIMKYENYICKAMGGKYTRL